MYEKLTKCPNFTRFLPEKLEKIPEFLQYFFRKINKIPEFYTIFARKNARMLHNNCPKNIFPNFRGGALCAPPPVSYAYNNTISAEKSGTGTSKQRTSTTGVVSRRLKQGVVSSSAGYLGTH